LSTMRQGFWKHFPLAGTLGAIVAAEMAVVLMTGFQTVEDTKLASAAMQVSNTKELGKVLYGAYVYPVQIAAVILLVAIIAAISLTLRSRKDSKYADPSEQVRVKASDRLVIVKMDASSPVLEGSQSSPKVNTASDAIKIEGGKA
jgi:NADH-quinone oxidoreductase subunit J